MSVITGQGVTAYPLPDEELSPTSKNAVSNEAVCEGLDEIKNTLDHKADAIYDTASGDIASFPDGADGLPVKDLTVSIEPVQDLHGYENPWPGGGGKNKLEVKHQSTTIGTLVYTVNSDGSIKINGTVGTTTHFTLTNNDNSISQSQTTPFKAGDVLKFSTGNSSYKLQARGTNGTFYTFNNNESVTLASDLAVVYLAFTQGASISNVTLYPMIRLASVSDDSFAPYSNICPISGWTGANVGRAGFNIFDENDVEDGIWRTWSGGAGDKADNAGYKRSKGYIPIKPNTQYYIIKNGETDGNIGFYDKNKAFLNKLYNFSSLSSVLTTPSDALYMTIYRKTTLDGTCINISDESKNGTYEPYTGNTLIPISWQSEAGTVYGGTLDVTSGVLTVDRALTTLTDESPFTIQNIQNNRALANFNVVIPIENYSAEYLCDMFGSNTAAANTDIIGSYVYSSSFRARLPETWGTTVKSIQEKLSNNPISVVYHLAEPITYQLDPVTVSTLLGQNNIWADTGDSTVEYPCDTKLYIQKINTPTDDDMIADANIASGKYFIVNNNLYISTAAILAGDPIKPGTNCTLTNLAAALNAINS